MEISTDLEDTTCDFFHISPLKSYWDPKGKDRPNQSSIFRSCVKLWGCKYFKDFGMKIPMFSACFLWPSLGLSTKRQSSATPTATFYSLWIWTSCDAIILDANMTIPTCMDDIRAASCPQSVIIQFAAYSITYQPQTFGPFCLSLSIFRKRRFLCREIVCPKSSEK